MSHDHALTTPDGDPIVAWGTYGSVRGYGPLRRRRHEALSDLLADQDGCKAERGYSDRNLVAVDAEGFCWALDFDAEAGSEVVSHWVPGAGGPTHGAARYELSSLKGA